MPTTPEYYQKNKEKILQKSKERYKKKKAELIEYQKRYRSENRNLINTRVRDKRLRRLKDAIELLGGKCQRCLQTFDPVCYDFHHVDPSQKDVTIGENMLIGEDRFFNEVKKCMLLCSNCHRITHKELRNAN